MNATIERHAHRALLLLLLTIATVQRGIAADELPWPSGWTRFGDPEFVMGVVELENEHGRALLIESDEGDDDRFGAIGQTIDAASYRGRRIQLSGLLRTNGASAGAGLWMRVDRNREDGDRDVLAFDNMGERAVRGNTEWARYTVVLDIPSDADTITFGALLRGAGTAWVDELSLDEATEDTAGTAMALPKRLKADS